MRICSFSGCCHLLRPLSSSPVTHLLLRSVAASLLRPRTCFSDLLLLLFSGCMFSSPICFRFSSPAVCPLLRSAACYFLVFPTIICCELVICSWVLCIMLLIAYSNFTLLTVLVFTIMFTDCFFLRNDNFIKAGKTRQTKANRQVQQQNRQTKTQRRTRQTTTKTNTTDKTNEPSKTKSK